MQTDGLKYIKWLSSHRQAYGFSPRIYNSGKLKAYRTITNYRYYTQEHYAIVCSWRLTKAKREEKKKNAKAK